MKPDLVTCQNCGKPIAKGKWCSDKCRMAFKRTQPEHEQNVPEHEQNEQKGEQTLQHEQILEIYGVDGRTLTRTDRTFFDRAMRDFKKPYYNFGETIHKEKCLFCGKEFRTSLNLLKYCCYQHYSDAIAGKK